MLDCAIDELPVLLGELRNERTPHEVDARHFAGPGAAPVAIIGVEGAACHEDREWARLSTVQAYADLLESFGRSFAGEGAR